MLQSAAVRAAGFAIVPLSEVAPALQALFVIMMYIAVYPIAMSIRSTNVYESKSLGVFDDSDDESEHEAEWDRQKPKMSTYIAYHARRQLSFDMCVACASLADARRWYLVLALFLIAIIEKDNIQDPASDSYFNLFTIIFDTSYQCVAEIGRRGGRRLGDGSEVRSRRQTEPKTEREGSGASGA